MEPEEQGNGRKRYSRKVKTRVSRLCDQENEDATFESHEDLEAISCAWFHLLKVTKGHSSGYAQQAVKDVRLSTGVNSE